MKLLEKPAFMRNMVVLVVLVCITGLAAFDKTGEQTVSVIFGAVVAGILTKSGEAQGRSEK